MTNDDHTELERLRRLRQGTKVGLSALEKLRERGPQDDLELRSLTKLDQRLVDRIAWMERAEAIAAE